MLTFNQNHNRVLLQFWSLVPQAQAQALHPLVLNEGLFKANFASQCKKWPAVFD